MPDKTVFDSDGTTTRHYSDNGLVLETPLGFVSGAPQFYVCRDPSTGIPAYCPPPAATGVPLGGGNGSQTVPTDMCTQIRCGVSDACTGHLTSLYEQWSAWLDPLVAGIADFAIIASLIDPFFDGLLLTLEVASDIAIANAIKGVLELAIGAVAGAVFPGLNHDEEEAIHHALFCQLTCANNVVTVIDTNIAGWHDGVANINFLPGLSRDLLTILLQFTPLADWQAAALSSGPSSACNAWTCP